MGFAVELYFDAATEASVKTLWETLSRKGISSALPASGARPHISLAVFESIDAARLCEDVRVFASESHPFTVTLSAVGSFPTAEGVVFIAPVVTRTLLRLHDRYHDRLTNLGVSPIDYYHPGNWIPHCTVAIDLPSRMVSAAIDVCLRSEVFVAGVLAQIAVVEFRPVRELCVFPLGNKGSEY